MADKPKRASEYKSEQVELVRSTCCHDHPEEDDEEDRATHATRLTPSSTR
jgi:hypothetical protein